MISSNPTTAAAPVGLGSAHWHEIMVLMPFAVVESHGAFLILASAGILSTHPPEPCGRQGAFEAVLSAFSTLLCKKPRFPGRSRCWLTLVDVGDARHSIALLKWWGNRAGRFASRREHSCICVMRRFYALSGRRRTKSSSGTLKQQTPARRLRGRKWDTEDYDGLGPQAGLAARRVLEDRPGVSFLGATTWPHPG